MFEICRNHTRTHTHTEKGTKFIQIFYYVRPIIVIHFKIKVENVQSNVHIKKRIIRTKKKKIQQAILRINTLLLK